jgi:hypothetical protein
MGHSDLTDTRPAGDADLPSSLPRLDTPLGERTPTAFCTGARDEGRGAVGSPHAEWPSVQQFCGDKTAQETTRAAK